MTFPLVIPNIGYDAGLNAMLAVSITGMGVNLGRHLQMDITRDTFFDDQVIGELNEQYLSHEISIGSLVEKVRSHFDDRGGAWGFKLTHGLSLLPIYRRMYPDMALLTGRLGEDVRLNNVITQLSQEDTILGATLPEIWTEIEAKMNGLNEFTTKVPTLVIPAELFEYQRQKGLAQMAAFLGGDYRSGNVAKMVDSAQRKLLHVFDEKEVGSGYVSG